MYIPQKHLENVRSMIRPGKVLVIYGARRVGKTTLLRKYMEEVPADKELWVNGDDIIARRFIESQSVEQLKDFIGHHEYLIIDEAQYVKHIGLNLKLIVDHIPTVKVIAIGSSSFDLSQEVGEPLTGRKLILRMFPLSQIEISGVEKPHETASQLEARLIYGTYPEVVTTRDNKFREEYLRELTTSYLFKDILALEGVRYSEKMVRLLQLLAFQIGNDVSLSELGSQLSMSKNTVERYLDLMEKVFVIFKLSGFSRNLRKEITKSRRYFFYDTGIRNALIGLFHPMAMRDDAGKLWENYVIAEMHKRSECLRHSTRFYFWRTYDKKEIDLIAEDGADLCAYEMKWRKAKAKPPKPWLENYPSATFDVVHRENYLKFIL